MPTLVIEDGSLVANANSYVALTDARSYATDRGLTLVTDDTTLTTYLIQATDYLEAQRGRYKGGKVDPGQSLQWPRQDVEIDGNDWSTTAIPNELKQAQIRLAVELSAGNSLMPSRTGNFVVSEKVGSLETVYSEKIATEGTPFFAVVEALLEPLCTSTNGTGFALSLGRA